MIIGHGDIASAIPAHLDRPDWTWFASGVSNSAETNEDVYRREFDLLAAQPVNMHFVYFSSLCVFYSESHYAKHKWWMEKIVKERFTRFTIIRLGTITWGRNPHLLIPYLRARHAAGLPLEIRDEWRYVCDLDEFRHWLGMAPPWSCEMNIPGRRMKVAEIVREFVYGAEGVSPYQDQGRMPVF